jgi:predicted DNA-binding transcriptional regulator YafY
MNEDLSARHRVAKRLAVLMALAQRGRKTTLGELAMRLECSTRTVRRDVATLYQAGIIGRQDLVTIRDYHWHS